MKTQLLNKTLKLTYIAVLSALCIIPNVFSIQLSGSNYLSFTYIPTFLAGIYFGPIAGGAVGLIGDIVGFLIRPTGPSYNPIIALSSTMLGVIPGLVWMATKRTRLHPNVKLVISLVVTSIVITSGLNTFATWLFYSTQSKTFWAYLLTRLPFQLIMVVVNGVILAILLSTKVMDRLLLSTLSSNNDNDPPDTNQP